MEIATEFMEAASQDDRVGVAASPEFAALLFYAALRIVHQRDPELARTASFSTYETPGSASRSPLSATYCCDPENLPKVARQLWYARFINTWDTQKYTAAGARKFHAMEAIVGSDGERVFDAFGDKSTARPVAANEPVAARLRDARQLHQNGQLTEAVDAYSREVASLNELVEKQGRVDLTDDLAAVRLDRGVALRDLGRWLESLEDCQASVALYHWSLEVQGRADSAIDVAKARANCGNVLMLLNRPLDALTEYDQATAHLRQFVEICRRSQTQGESDASQRDTGAALPMRRRLEEALVELDRASSLRRRISDAILLGNSDEPFDTGWLRDHVVLPAPVGSAQPNSQWNWILLERQNAWPSHAMVREPVGRAEEWLLSPGKPAVVRDLEAAAARGDEKEVARLLRHVPLDAILPPPVASIAARVREQRALISRFVESVNAYDFASFRRYFECRQIREMAEMLQPLHREIAAITAVEICGGLGQPKPPRVTRGVVRSDRSHCLLKWNWPPRAILDRCLVGFTQHLPPGETSPLEVDLTYRRDIDMWRYEEQRGLRIELTDAHENCFVLVWGEIDLGFTLLYSKPLVLGRTDGQPFAQAWPGYEKRSETQRTDKSDTQIPQQVPPHPVAMRPAAFADASGKQNANASEFPQTLEAALRDPNRSHTRTTSDDDGETATCRSPAEKKAAAAHAGHRDDFDTDAFASQAIVIRYPTPIAIAYRRFLRQTDVRTRLEMLVATLESTLRYLVTIGVTEVFHSLALSGTATPALPAHPAFDFLRWPTKMSLGMWIDALRETTRYLATQPQTFMPELARICGPGSEFLEGSANWIVRNRNAWIHEGGGIRLTPDECRDVLREARPRLERALQEIAFLCQYPLGFVHRSAGFAGDRGWYTYHVHACMGAHVDGTSRATVIRTPEVLRESTPLIAAPSGTRLMYLWPLLHERPADHTGRHSLYVFEEIRNSRFPFLGEIKLASIDLRDSWQQRLREQPTASHQWVIDFLRSTPAVQSLSADSQIASRLLPRRGGKLAGRKLGDYQLKDVVALGGFGTIYSATDAHGALCAVKVIESADASRRFSRFREEIKRLRQASASEHVIQLFADGIDLVDEREYPWYAMQFAAGGDLSERLEERQRLAAGHAPWTDDTLRPNIIADITAILAGLAHLHALHIIHRDIKPGNILILDSGELRLSDFGLAKNLSPTDESLVAAPRTSTGAVLGTRHYMAPEQEQGDEAGKTADIYALGMVLAELVCGERPKPKANTRTGSTIRGFNRLNELPRSLKALLLRCTDIQPSRRFPDARAVEVEFAQVVANGGPTF